MLMYVNMDMKRTINNTRKTTRIEVYKRYKSNFQIKNKTRLFD
jgi:hypothetical protein